MSIESSETGLSRLVKRARVLQAEGGIGKVLTQSVEKLYVYAATPVHRVWRAGRTFRFQGREYPYFCDNYNATWRNERGVEVALALAFLQRRAPGRTLELGNVMPYYTSFAHDVVDKYEPTPGVLNLDILDYRPSALYDTVLTISTLEHIGWDEPKREKNKALEAIEKIKSLTHESGRLFVTFPLGHNAFLDEHLAAGRVDLPNMGFLKRVSAGNDWEETTLEGVLGAKYNSPYRAANALCVAMTD
jgi:hypothetical protein